MSINSRAPVMSWRCRQGLLLRMLVFAKMSQVDKLARPWYWVFA